MATCSTCFGTGQINGHGYQNCSGCGGGGMAGGGICPYCAGSGTSSVPNKDICFTCHGAGIVDDPPIYRPKKNSVSKQNVKSKKGSASVKTRSGNDEFSSGFAAVAFILVSLSVYKPEDENGVAALILGCIAGVLAGKFYKAIITLGVIIFLIFIFGYEDFGG